MKVVKKLSYRVLFKTILILVLLLLLSIDIYCLTFLWNSTYLDTKKFESNNFKVEINKAHDDYLSLVMVGDSLIHEAVYGDASINGTFDFKPMFQYIKPIIQNFDLAFYNQESILGGRELKLSTYPRFNSPYEVGDAFIDMGFNIVSLANNHTLDRGVDAINNSRKYWNSKDVLVNGSATSAEERENFLIKEKNNISYTMLAYTDYTNGLSTNGKDYLVNRIDFDTIKKDIEKVRDKVDLLIVSVHFGEEYNLNVTKRQREIAEFLANNGVDIVIGHHPHVVSKMEFINNTLVVYSLGNFISAQRGVERLTGLMASVDIHKYTINEKSTITLENPAAELVYTYTDYINGSRKNFRVYPYSMLNDELLPNYKSYYDKYMNIVVGNSNLIEKR